MFAFLLLMVLVIIIAIGLLVSVIGGPIILPLAVLAVMIIPLAVMVYAGRFYSLSPLAVALVQPGRPRSKGRFLMAWLVILALAAFLTWTVGAVSVVGLSSKPLTGLFVYPPPGAANWIVGTMYNAFTVSVFMAFGLCEVGVPTWALIAFVSSLFGRDRMAIYEKKRFRYLHKLEYVDDFGAWFLADVASILPVIGLAIVIFVPVVIGSTIPYLYTSLHMGGWSPLAKVPGLVKQVSPVSIYYENWKTLTELFPLSNWSVLFAALPPGLRDVLIGLLILAGLSLLVMLGGDKERPLSSEDRRAMAEYQRVMREVHDGRGDVIVPSEEEKRYAKALEDYWTHKRAWYPKPEEFALTAEIINEKIAERTGKSRRARGT